MKTNGPGKYDALATFCMEDTGAEGVGVIVVGGKLGAGFSVQGTERFVRSLPDILETMARGIREDLDGKPPSR